jgi:hypothetical protein
MTIREKDLVIEYEIQRFERGFVLALCPNFIQMVVAEFDSLLVAQLVKSIAGE